MKKILLMLLSLTFVCNASQVKQSDKIVNEEIIQLKQQVAKLDKKIDAMTEKIDQLHKKSLPIEPIVSVEMKLIDTIEEQSVKKPKISWGKRAYQKGKAVEKKVADKKDDKKEKEESIADAADANDGNEKI